ncbi:hypothetical protein [Lewinella sp. W8]|uniref:hypothetical protein n=1 Tax=Lewinella sp. W8 TaxID=2528208 RepID=UPI0010687A2D|nr:hypothetical protein [Lewinella sp. W8]MTB51958.1 hypothetical protein [Lewinella sp. W8]
MKSFEEKERLNNSLAAAHHVGGKARAKDSEGKDYPSFEDHRPVAALQQKIHALANHGPTSTKGAPIQAKGEWAAPFSNLLAAGFDRLMNWLNPGGHFFGDYEIGNLENWHEADQEERSPQDLVEMARGLNATAIDDFLAGQIPAEEDQAVVEDEQTEEEASEEAPPVPEDLREMAAALGPDALNAFLERQRPAPYVPPGRRPGAQQLNNGPYRILTNANHADVRHTIRGIWRAGTVLTDHATHVAIFRDEESYRAALQAIPTDRQSWRQRRRGGLLARRNGVTYYGQHLGGNDLSIDTFFPTGRNQLSIRIEEVERILEESGSYEEFAERITRR